MQPHVRPSLTTPAIVSGSAAAFAFVYALLGKDPFGLTALYIRFGPVISLISWTVADLRRTELGSIHDWGFFQFVAWPVLIPWYLKYRYQQGAWPLIGKFTAALLAPPVASGIGDAIRVLRARGAA